MKSNVKTERRDGQNLRCQSAVGLLLLTLLAANPLQALGQGTIGSDSYDGFYLNDNFSPPINSVTVLPGVTLDNSSSGSDAISGDTHTWNLTVNDATLNGSYNGVYLGAGGSVNNSGGSISGGNYGVTFDGKAGSMVNSGQINGDNNDGVRLRAGGSVNNQSGGTIDGNTGGVKITGGAGTVINADSIRGDWRDGVYMDSGGTVNNLANGTIYGNRYGVEITNGVGYVTNYGSITGQHRDGVRLRAGGTVNNESGNIWGNTGGVKITGGVGTVINGGSINGENADGVSMDSGGSVYNFQSTNYYTVLKTAKTITDGIGGEAGTISGGQNGVVISGGTGNVYNNGSIIGGANTPSSVASFARPNFIGGGYDGVYLGAGGSVYNDTNGTISGTDNGVNVNASPSSVVNRGSIYGVNSGVYMGQGSSLSNLNGTITGGDNGVFVSGGAANVYNRGGSIIGQTGDGVFMNSGGNVVNKNSRNHGNYSGNENATTSAFNGNTIATIEGGEYGVDISGDTGTVINSGTIIGTNNAGVSLEAGGTVVNQTSQRHGNHSRNDYETASGYDGNNIPTIEGGRYGVEISGGTNAVVINSGTIIGITNAGVRLENGGTVVNQTSQRHGNNRGNDYNAASGNNGNNIPTIEGGINGVNILGGLGFVTNSGSISGGTGAGVWLHDGGGGTVVNQASQRHGNYSGNDSQTASAYNENIIPTIAGGGWGVVIGGGDGTVINSGTIIGTNDAGVLLTDGGTVVNQTSRGHGNNRGDDYETASAYNGNNIPTITGGKNGVNIFRGTNNVVINSGSITGVTNDGVWLHKGGSVYNKRHGNISGGNNGVEINGGTGYVSNDGDISGVPVIPPDSVESSAKTQLQAGGNGVYMGLGGSVDNKRHGTIEGGNNGVEIIGGPGSVSNDGDISGGVNSSVDSVESSAKLTQLQVGGDGVYLGDGGTVDNKRRGNIYGYNGYGVEIYGGAGVVVNSGYIYGGNGTAILMATALTSGFSNSVTLKSRSETIGNIDGGGNGTDAAFLEGHGQYDYGFTNFATLNVQAWGCRGWNLTGTNFFSTGVTVESGKLRINGELDTPLVTVDSDGSLGGTGPIWGIVDNYGDLTPGNSIGTQFYVTLTNHGNYVVEVDNTPSSDLILVSNTATIISGDVIVRPARQIYGSNTVYTILTATNGVFGEFDANYIDPTLPYSSLFLASSLSNDLNNVYLNLHRIKFTTVANTYNQNSVAGALDGIVDSPTPGMSNLVTEFFWLPDAGEARAALDSLSGEIHGTLGMLDVQQQDAFNNSIAQRTGRMSASSGNGGYSSSSKPVQLASAGSTLPPMQQAETNLLDIWLQGFGSFGHLDGDGNALGGDYTISGLSGGLDYRLCPQMLVGLGLGYSHDDANVGGPGASGKVDAFQVAGYGGYVDGPWHLDGILSYGFLQTDTKRFINVGSISQEADGKYDGGVLSLSAEGGYAFAFDWLTVEPTIGLNYSHLWQDSFNESGTATDGNNYGLHVNDVSMDSFRSALGVRLAAQFGKKDGVQFIPALRAVWEHEFMDRYADVNARFVGGSGDFNVRGVELGADSGILGVGLTVAFNKTVQGFVNYDANLNSQLTSSTISGGLSISW